MNLAISLKICLIQLIYLLLFHKRKEIVLCTIRKWTEIALSWL